MILFALAGGHEFAAEWVLTPATVMVVEGEAMFMLGDESQDVGRGAGSHSSEVGTQRAATTHCACSCC